MGFLEDMQSSLFFTGGAGAPQGGATAQAMRQKIALAMMMKKNPYPKTFGEGLAAIGDAWGDRSLAARLEKEAADQSAATDAAIASKIPPLSATTGPRADAGGDPPLAAVASAVDTPADDAATPAATPVAALHQPPQLPRRHPSRVSARRRPIWPRIWPPAGCRPSGRPTSVILPAVRRRAPTKCLRPALPGLSSSSAAPASSMGWWVQTATGAPTRRPRSPPPTS